MPSLFYFFTNKINKHDISITSQFTKSATIDGKICKIYHRHSNKYLDVERTHRARSTTSTQDLLSTALLSPDIETVVLLE